MKEGDKLEVKVRNEFWHAYFKREIDLGNEKAKTKLLHDLKNIGVDFKAWVEDKKVDNKQKTDIDKWME